MNSIHLMAALLFCANAYAQSPKSIESLQAQTKSMKACQISLKNDQCNLKILDASVRETLIQLDRLKEQRTKTHSRTSAKRPVSGSVRFFTDTISDADGEILRFLGGSVWMLDRDYFGLPLEEVVGISIDKESATIYANGDVYQGKLIKGYADFSAGYLASVIETKGDGTVLKLDDGTLLEFSDYDKYDTGYWLPPYQVLIDSSKAYMWNLEESKKVDIESVIK